MLAKKENKEYNVDEVSKQTYLSQGYDIYNDKGKLVESAKTKTVPYSEYEKVVKELEKLKKNQAKEEPAKE